MSWRHRFRQSCPEGATLVTAIRHFGIVVSDMVRSLAFYQDLLGLEVVRALDESGSFVDTILGLEHVHVKTVKMGVGDGASLLELLEFRSHHDSCPARAKLYSVGPTHVAFTVQDLGNVYRRLRESGVEFTSPPQCSPDGYARVAFCIDPDGTPIELVEVLS